MKITNREYQRFYTDLFLRLLEKSKNNFYDESALPSYTHKNRLMSYLFWKRVDVSLTLLENKMSSTKKINVLDFGCGGGVTFRHLEDRNYSITGCDKEHFNLAKVTAAKIKGKIKIISDIEKIKNEKYDVIFALDVLEHIEDLSKIIEKFKILLKPEGFIILSGPTENIFYKFGRFLARFSGHYHISNIYDIEKRFQKNGFQRTYLKNLYYPVPLFRISVWKKNLNT